MIVSKHYPCLEFLNHAIIKIMENGQLEKMQKEHIPCLDEVNNDEQPPSLKKTVTLFVILFFGMFCSLACFIIERFIYTASTF